MVQQLDRPNDAEDRLNLILKLDAAIFGQRQSSRVVVLARTNLSSGVWIGWTTDLESLGSNKPVHRVPPLQMAPSGSRCLYCGVGCT